MSSQHNEATSRSHPASVFHVSVVEDGTVEVSGGTPQEVVDLLQSVGNQVVINGDILSQAEPDPALDDLNDLSERELQILALIASGHSNQDIAAESFLSINTIKSYIRSAYRKMDVQSRSQAVIWAIDRGVVGPHPDQPSS